jgi:hypothetical protein
MLIVAFLILPFFVLMPAFFASNRCPPMFPATFFARALLHTHHGSPDSVQGFTPFVVVARITRLQFKHIVVVLVTECICHGQRAAHDNGMEVVLHGRSEYAGCLHMARAAVLIRMLCGGMVWIVVGFVGRMRTATGALNCLFSKFSPVGIMAMLHNRNIGITSKGAFVCFNRCV